ncbi:hypothetical protein RD792_003774 [Penstemon davidsonii]|uniref:Cupin type-1 domain-containing protein n=1 Tax=Penstemon davidsonii TaxID=160366 RepID=A0ABR0DFL8_9LAMI|nr:hypothetical protein RD792_003774 [Penstemon davidsonii]
MKIVFGFLATILIVSLAPFSFASDPSPLQDFCVAVNDSAAPVFVNGKFCKNPNMVVADDFFFSGLNKPGNTSNAVGSRVTAVNVNNLPGLNTLGISAVRIDYAPYGLNPPHTHPRATEILVVLEGTLYVGFVTSNPANPNLKNKLFTKYLNPGDVFVFPEGLIHFQFNAGKTNAVAFAGLSSQNPGVITIANAVFGSDPSINPDVLSKAFQVEKKDVARRNARNISQYKFHHRLGRMPILKLEKAFIAEGKASSKIDIFVSSRARNGKPPVNEHTTGRIIKQPKYLKESTLESMMRGVITNVLKTGPEIEPVVLLVTDPSPLQDFCVAVNDSTAPVFVNGKFCKNPNMVVADDFFFSGLNKPGNTSNAVGSRVTAVNVNNLPGLNTLGISAVRIDYAPYGLNPPHTHPRATEILVVLEGTLYVGFVTSNPANPNLKNKLFTKYLNPGDVFVFPEGLIHFQFNAGKTNAVAFAGLSSQNPGVITIANAVFGSDLSINPDVLAKAFQVEKKVIDQLQAKF